MATKKGRTTAPGTRPSSGPGPTRKGRTTAPGTTPRNTTPATNLIEENRFQNRGTTPVRKGRTTAPGTAPYNFIPQFPANLAGQGRGAYGPTYTPPDPRDLQDEDRGYRYGAPPAGWPNTGGGNDPGGGGNGGSGGGGLFGGEVPIEEEPVDPSIAAQQAFIDRLMSLQSETMAGYPGATTNIQGYYDAASKDLADPFNDYYNAARGGAENLGYNFEGDDNVKLADLAARKLQENYDLNETTDLATVEKMKALNHDSFTQMLIAANARQIGPGLLADQIALEEAAALAGASSGGGGGGGGGRGGGGSGGGGDNPWSEKATQDEQFFNPGVSTDIAGITDPIMRAAATRMYGANGTNVKNALNASYDYQDVANAYTPPPVTSSRRTLFNKATYGRQKGKQASANAKNQRDLKAANYLVNFFSKWSPGITPQTTKQSVSTTSTTKHT